MILDSIMLMSGGKKSGEAHTHLPEPHLHLSDIVEEPLIVVQCGDVHTHLRTQQLDHPSNENERWRKWDAHTYHVRPLWNSERLVKVVAIGLPIAGGL